MTALSSESDPSVAAALDALKKAAVQPIGGGEIACADSTTALWVHYAVVSALEGRTAEDMVRALQVLNTAAAVIAAHLGAGLPDVRPPALRPTAWVDGMQRVFRDPHYANVLSQSLHAGVGLFQSVEADLALLVSRTGRTE